MSFNCVFDLFNFFNRLINRCFHCKNTGNYNYPVSCCGKWSAIFTKLFFGLIIICILDFFFALLGSLITWGISTTLDEDSNTTYYSIWDGLYHFDGKNITSYMCYINYKSWRFWVVCSPIGFKIVVVLCVIFWFLYYISYQCCCAKSIREIYKENIATIDHIKVDDENRNTRFSTPSDESSEYLIFGNTIIHDPSSREYSKDDNSKDDSPRRTESIVITKKKMMENEIYAGTF